MTIAYIAMGSNLNLPLEQLDTALDAIQDISCSQVVAVSSYYRTVPLGQQNQPDYLNAAIALKTNLTPELLLDALQYIELKQGRIRNKNRWHSRTIDLDIMLFGKENIQTDRLTIPHYDVKNRDFMLWPLFEIAPKLKFPDGETLKTVLSYLNKRKPTILVSKPCF